MDCQQTGDIYAYILTRCLDRNGMLSVERTCQADYTRSYGGRGDRQKTIRRNGRFCSSLLFPLRSLFACIKPTSYIVLRVVDDDERYYVDTNSVLLQLCILAKSEEKKNRSFFFIYHYITLALTLCV